LCPLRYFTHWRKPPISASTYFQRRLPTSISVAGAVENKKTHVLRFSKILTQEAVDEIYKHTIEKGKFHKMVNEMLIRQSASIQTSDRVLVDSNLAVESDNEIRELIELAGFEFINEGRWKEVILLHRKGSGTIVAGF
jgi:hypothetical protein